LKEAYVVDAIDRKFKCKIPRSWRKGSLHRGRVGVTCDGGG